MAEAVVADLTGRVIEPADFVADRRAFVDVRLPRSEGKASYSFIGPGVSQNADQTVQLDEPHGFNVGAASMPHGVVNNPHLHFTAEVFICTRGSWRVDIGEHGEQTLELAAGGVFSAPNWVFRGFENTGPDDSWMFVVLGGDDTGGILWAPHVLREAAETGLYLATDHSVIDTTTGASAEDVLVPLDSEQTAAVDRYTDAELAERAVAAADLRWSDRALLSAVLPGHASATAPVIGHGVSEDRRHRAPITTAHGFSVEWLRLPPGSTTGSHRLGHHQVLLLAEGAWEIAVNHGAHRRSVRPATGSVVSLPVDAWRTFTNVGDADALAAVVCETDSPSRVEWSDDVVAAAAAAGWTRDANGCVAPIDLVGRPALAPAGGA